MARNLKKEHEWAREKYEQFKIQIDKQMGLNFRAYLKNNGIKIADWFRQAIENTLTQTTVEESYEQIHKELKKQIDDGLKGINELLEEVQNKTPVPVNNTSTSIGLMKLMDERRVTDRQKQTQAHLNKSIVEVKLEQRSHPLEGQWRTTEETDTIQQVPVQNNASTSIQVPVQDIQAPVLLSYKQVAEMKGVTPEIVRMATRRGKLKKTADAKINYEDAIKWNGIG